MTPRNLRKPTARRCDCWWADYIAAWRVVGIAVDLDGCDDLEPQAPVSGEIESRR